MKRFRVLLIIFFIALAVPLGYFVARTYYSLGQEEKAELRFFTETLFDRMEEELSLIVQREEARSVDEYSYFMLRPGEARGSTPGKRSPLSYSPDESYVLGYFQNNPDGSFQSPQVFPNSEGADAVLPAEHAAELNALQELNAVFNTKRTRSANKFRENAPTEADKDVALKKAVVSKSKKNESRLLDKYLSSRRDNAWQKVSLGQEKQRLEEITQAQAEQIMERKVVAAPAARSAPTRIMSPTMETEESLSAPSSYGEPAAGMDEKGGRSLFSSVGKVLSDVTSQSDGNAEVSAVIDTLSQDTFRVEVAPLQSVFIDDQHLFLFRNIVVGEQIYRQGFIIVIQDFLSHLVAAHYQGQPLSRFTGMELIVSDQGRTIARTVAGQIPQTPEFFLERRLPRPFSFLTASLSSSSIPPTAGRTTLTIMTIACGVIMILGFIAVYHSVRVVVELSERRAGFVSSVTHELKTPLTTIRMYIEMLEQGIADNPEREEEYFRILLSETSRLSRLINNVLEFSRLERKQRKLAMEEGDLQEVVRDVTASMAEKLRQEGFVLKVECENISVLSYDREAMVQILINLLDNSIKFGRDLDEKRICITLNQNPKQTVLSVSDTGPGISRKDLRRVFDDFYREDNSLTRRTQGTGIGLALVKKLATAMGGTVAATNNQGLGCTITITLPR